MNKTEIVERLADGLGTSKAEAKRLLEAQVDAIAHHLAVGDTVVLRGLGSFGTREVAGHRGRRPTDGETLDIPAGRQVTFRPSDALRKAVQRGEPES